MTDRTKGVLLDVGKFALTGVLAFLSSFVYTNYATRPANNVSIVPLSVDSDPACLVASDKLQATIAVNDQGHVVAASGEQYTAEFKPGDGDKGWRWEFHRRPVEVGLPRDGYATYLKNLNTQYILKKLVEPNLLERLQKDEVVTCEKPRSESRQELSRTTVLRVQGIMVIDDPSSYALKRDCTLHLDQKAIPVRAFNQLTSSTAPTTGDSDERTLSVEKSSPIFFKYDPSMAPANSEHERLASLDDAIDALLRAKESRRDYPLAVTCDVISAKGGVVSVGGRVVQFVGGSLKQG